MVAPHNKQLQRTVQTVSRAAQRASFHYARAPRSNGQRAAAERGVSRQAELSMATIRRASPADAAALASLAEGVFRDMFGSANDPGRCGTLCYNELRFSGSVARNCRPESHHDSERAGWRTEWVCSG